jgi:ABC-type sugar transport system ATPase subunit
MSYIRFENIDKSFGSTRVLQDIRLEIGQGQDRKSVV